jgi:F0F1-type ATP synthase membrane subunit b/b'
MIEETQPKRRGRPATGVTTKRNVRIGDTWDHAEKLEAQLAEQEGRRPNVTAYVEAALRRENARVERQLRRSIQDDT